MLGNVKDAKLAYQFAQEFWGDGPQTWKKAGWQYVTSGSTRSVWLSPTGVIYKVTDDEEMYVNTDEYETYVRNRKTKVKGFALAPCRKHMFKTKTRLGEKTVVVNSQRYIQGKKEPVDWSTYYGSALESELTEGFSKYNLTDVHNDQYRVVGKKRVIFDYAC